VFKGLYDRLRYLLEVNGLLYLIGTNGRVNVRHSHDQRGAQPLVTDHGQIRSVDNRAHLLTPPAVRPMARGS
jgi:hypothetical protein